jgi:hypothetical protein
MADPKVFTIEIEVYEHPDRTEARAVLDLEGRACGGWGRSRRNPADHDRPTIGDELAIARALVDLAHHLGHDVTSRIEETEGGPVEVHL